jgi:hypothetical protein
LSIILLGESFHLLSPLASSYGPNRYYGLGAPLAGSMSAVTALVRGDTMGMPITYTQVSLPLLDPALFIYGLFALAVSSILIYKYA